MIQFDFTGKTVVITGGATGIGRATAQAYAKAGANVVIGDVSSSAEETVGLITAEHEGKANFVKTDVTSEEDVKNLMNTASVGGLIADPDMVPYAAAKHGVVGLTKAAAIDHGKDGIRVNAIAPGLVETAMTQVWREDPAKWAEATGANALGRAASPEEIAATVHQP